MNFVSSSSICRATFQVLKTENGYITFKRGLEFRWEARMGIKNMVNIRIKKQRQSTKVFVVCSAKRPIKRTAVTMVGGLRHTEMAGLGGGGGGVLR